MSLCEGCGSASQTLNKEDLVSNDFHKKRAKKSAAKKAAKKRATKKVAKKAAKKKSAK